MRSAGNTVGSLLPALADSQRYMASTNSSHDSRPSLSTSESALGVVVCNVNKKASNLNVTV